MSSATAVSELGISHVESTAGPRRGGWPRRLALGALVPLLILVVWEVVTATGLVPAYRLPGPLAVLRADAFERAFAAGAVAHAEHYAGRLREVCPGPVDVIPLAFGGFALPPPRDIGRAGEVVVATVGHVNPNRRVADMLRAMADSAPLRERVRYRLIGAAEPAERRATSAPVRASSSAAAARRLR